MLPSQEQDLAEIQRQFNELLPEKYSRGALEHGGLGWQMPPQKLASELRNELIDGFTYLHWLEKWVGKLAKRISELEKENEELRNGKS